MFRTFIEDEKGAVTVDWVVLTSGLVGFGLATIGVVSGGLESLSTEISDSLSSGDRIQTSFATAISAAFDLSSYQYLSASQGFPTWQANTLPLLDEQAEYDHWLNYDFNQAMQSGGANRDMHADDYAVTYAQAQAQGIDLTGYVDPNELRTQVAADLGI